MRTALSFLIFALQLQFGMATARGDDDRSKTVVTQQRFADDPRLKSTFRITPGPDYGMADAAIRPDGKTIVTVGVNSKIQILDITTGNVVAALGQPGSDQRVAYSPDGNSFAAAGLGYEVKLWDATRRKLTMARKGHTGWIKGLAYSPDGKFFASASWDKTVRLWEVGSQREAVVLDGHGAQALSVAFAPQGQRLVSGGQDGQITLWDVTSGENVWTSNGHGWVVAIAFRPDDKVIASVAERDINFWDATSGKLIRTLQGHSESITSLAFSHDGKLLASGSQDGAIRLWSATDGSWIASLRGHDTSISAVEFTKDSKTLMTGSGDGAINLWSPIADEQARLPKKINVAIKVRKGRGVILENDAPAKSIELLTVHMKLDGLPIREVKQYGFARIAEAKADRKSLVPVQVGSVVPTDKFRSPFPRRSRGQLADQGLDLEFSFKLPDHCKQLDAFSGTLKLQFDEQPGNSITGQEIEVPFAFEKIAIIEN